VSVHLKRLGFLDSLRGFAMLIMAVYHFSFDLNEFQLIHEDMNHDPFWLNFRALIMTLFIGLSGIGYYLGHANYKSKSFQQRLLKIFVCAILISAVTYFVYPNSWIYFGILHFILLASLLAPVLIQLPYLCLPAGIFFVLLPNYFRHFWFIKPFWIITGLAPIKPNTEDFAPLLPWMGVVLLGIFVGFVIEKLNSKKEIGFLELEIPILSKMGQHSLLFYMTHQALLFPLALMISKI
jgi:uncharacterized membrane protein